MPRSIRAWSSASGTGDGRPTRIAGASCRAWFADYASLPGAVSAELLPFFGVPAGDVNAERLHEVPLLDAKAETAFRAETEPRDEEGTADGLASRWLDDAYTALAASRPR